MPKPLNIIVVFIIIFLKPFPFKEGDLKKTKLLHRYCHNHSLTVESWVEPSTAQLPQLKCCFISLYWTITNTRHMPPPIHIQCHSQLSCTHTLASWMSRSYLVNTSRTPSSKCFLGLPLYLTPLTTELHIFLTNLSSPILFICPSYLSTY